MTQLNSILLLSLTSLALSGCGNKFGETLKADKLSTPSLSLKLVGLEPMSGQHYEGWIINLEGPVSTGRFNIDAAGNVFNVNASGTMTSVAGQMASSQFGASVSVADAKAFILTIEPDGDTDASPSSVHYMAGEFNASGVAMAHLDSPSAIDAEFSGTSGSYILATPTNGPTTHNQGIWYLAAGAPTLQLPVLATGWAYEGWVVDTTTGVPTSTGIFFTAAGADEDGPGAGAGVNPAPPFPGQDFINPALVLNGGNTKAVITVEPYPDFDPAPFTIKILADSIAANAAVMTSFDLNNIANDAAISIEAKFK